ncbi:glycosyltransferase [Mucilaginibacter sp. 22184]|uniref:glycosyltransferase n=1 Tax=Mucilaginibacter sp. 22184 TaxID=3453887 RepID=UPI003F85F255
MEITSALPKKQRILFVIPSLMGGGAERVLISIANHFNQKGCVSIIVTLNRSEPAYDINKEVKVIYLLDRKNNKLRHRLKYMWLTFYKLMKLLLKEKPDSVLSFITSANIWTGVTCSVLRIPFVVSERTSPKRSINQFGDKAKVLIALLYQKSKAVVVGAQGIEECIRENKAFKNLKNICRITNAVPVFNTVSGNPVHHRRFILGVGRLEHVKGFDMLIAAFSNAQLSDIDLVIVGDGSEKSNLICQIYNLGLRDKVILAGSKTNLQDYYSQAELFVLPSRNEGYPNALVEAMSFGCPCIAMDCEFGPSEIINHEQNGLLVQATNTTDLANAINRLINAPQLRGELSKCALNINDTNSPTLIGKQWESLLLNNI